MKHRGGEEMAKSGLFQMPFQVLAQESVSNGFLYVSVSDREFHSVAGLRHERVGRGEAVD